MSLAINEFLEKYNLVDPKISSYDDDTRQMITEVINENVGNYANSENGDVLLYIGLYYKYAKKDYNSAEQYYLRAIGQNNHTAMNNLGLLY